MAISNFHHSSKSKKKCIHNLIILFYLSIIIKVSFDYSSTRVALINLAIDSYNSCPISSEEMQRVILYHIKNALMTKILAKVKGAQQTEMINLYGGIRGMCVCRVALHSVRPKQVEMRMNGQ